MPQAGHHLGGFAFYGAADWAASEGQADYFRHAGLRSPDWERDAQANAAHRNTVNPVAKTSCDAVVLERTRTCSRIADAGQSLANLLAMGASQMPNYATPDTTQVDRTDVEHPEAQCRLDTYFAGALCKATFDVRVIPGRNNSAGQLSIEAEREAGDQSCQATGGYTQGMRPRCCVQAPHLVPTSVLKRTCAR